MGPAWCGGTALDQLEGLRSQVLPHGQRKNELSFSGTILALSGVLCRTHPHVPWDPLPISSSLAVKGTVTGLFPKLLWHPLASSHISPLGCLEGRPIFCLPFLCSKWCLEFPVLLWCPGFWFLLRWLEVAACHCADSADHLSIRVRPPNFFNTLRLVLRQELLGVWLLDRCYIFSSEHWLIYALIVKIFFLLRK